MKLPLVSADALRPFGGGETLVTQLHALSREQRASWPELAEGHAALASIRRKEVETDGDPAVVQFNPRRVSSTAANIDEQSLRARPCFLCLDALPPAQHGLRVAAEYLALCNPRPIFDEHFTLSSRAHLPQRLHGREHLFTALLPDLAPDFALLFNGAKAGASAPDHLHFQIGPAAALPLLASIRAPREEVALLRYCGAPFILVHSPDPARVAAQLVQILQRIESRARGGEYVNVLGHYFGEYRVVIVPRRAHRPACFFADDPERLIISPATVELSGVMVTVREADFERLDGPLVSAILREVVLPEEEMSALLF